jgi:outer membrane protein OmpA-like peptidoglycan-associated protein
MMKKLLSITFLMLFSATFITAQNLPSNPDPGKCYVKCITKDIFETVTETIQVQPSYQKLSVIPVTYKTVEERVIVKESSKRLVVIPAVYETVDVAYDTDGVASDLTIVPAQFGTKTQSFEVYPKTSGWEYKPLEDCQSVNKEDCMYLCYVERPAQYRDVTITTLTKEASTTKGSASAAQRRTYKKQIIKTPARVTEEVIPAVYKTIKRRVVDQPARTVSQTVPTKTETITKTVLKSKGGITTWEEVDCKLLDPNILPIFYELASARLTSESKQIIDNTLMPILNDKNVNIEIMSHTDSRGNDAYNMSLSQQRANAVVNYLVSKGISRSRLSARGYGETRLVNRCSNGVQCSEVEHKRNRRTEFRVINN